MQQAKEGIPGTDQLPSPDVIEEKAKELGAEKAKLTSMTTQNELIASDVVAVEKHINDVQKKADSLRIAKQAQEERQKTARVIAKADATAARISEEKKQKVNQEKLAEQQRQATINAARDAVIKQQKAAVDAKGQAEKNIMDLELELKNTRASIKAQQITVLKRKVLTEASAIQSSTKTADEEAIKLTERRSKQEKNVLTKAKEDAETGVTRGKALLEEASDAIQGIKERILQRTAELTHLTKALSQAHHAEARAKTKAASSLDAVEKLHSQIGSLEKRKAASEELSQAIRTKAQRDAEVATQGAMKAEADYATAKMNFDKFSHLANKHRKEYQQQEEDRQKSVQAVMMALEANDVKSAIIGGENHEDVSKFVAQSKAEQDKFQVKAQSAQAAMEAATVDKKLAAKLQLNANKQLNEAAGHDEVIAHQRIQLKQLNSEAKEHEATAKKILGEAHMNTKVSQQDHDEAEKEMRIALAAKALPGIC